MNKLFIIEKESSLLFIWSNKQTDRQFGTEKVQNAATLLEINSYSTHYLIHSSSVIEEENLISYDAGK